MEIPQSQRGVRPISRDNALQLNKIYNNQGMYEKPVEAGI